MPPQALLIVFFIVLFAAFYFVVCGIKHHNEVAAKEAKSSWKQADKVGELITLYLDMAIKYGPYSKEAKGFCFGVNNSELWGNDSESLNTFKEIIKHFDDALIRNKKMFRWS